MTSTYWEGHNLRHICPGFLNLMYALPPGCELHPIDTSSNLVSNHTPNETIHPRITFPKERRGRPIIPRMDINYGDNDVSSYWNKTCGSNHVWVYQQCDNTTRPWIFGDLSGPWTYFEWLLTYRPNALGLMDGIAYPTGVALLSVLTIMIICSLPFIRRGGHFEVIVIFQIY